MSNNPIEKLVSKMNSDNVFAKNVYTDFEFAKKEFAQVGIQLDKQDYEKFVNARTAFENASKAIFVPVVASGTEVTGTIGIKRTF